MANQKISTLPAAVALVGSELIELVQGGANVKASIDFLKQASITKYALSGLTTGTYTDNALPGLYDYAIDYDTTTGDIELDGWVAQRDGQIVTHSNIGANLLKIGVNLGAAANRLRANAGPLVVLQNDSLTMQYIAAISRWIVV